MARPSDDNAHSRSSARLAAIAMGAGRFDPGVPCARGHKSMRYTSNTVCIQCANTARRNKLSKPRKPVNQRKAEHAETARLMRELHAAQSKLPKKAALALVHYFDSTDGRANSRHLNRLIKAMHTKPEPIAEPPASHKTRGRDTHDWQSRLTERRSNP